MEKKPLHKFVRLSGVGIQIGVTMYLAAYFGKKLDTYYGNEKKISTLIFILVGLVFSIYSILAQVKNTQDN